jgi:hypothetical protein
MANRDGRLFNVDRWTIYTLQRLYLNKRYGKHHYSYGWGDHLPLTPAQRRRCLKNMHKHNDYSIGMYSL